MTYERNIEGLRKSAQLRHQQTIQRTEEGIRRLLREGRPVNFNTVAETAGVSTAWLYQHPEVRSRIEYLRAMSPFFLARLSVALWRVAWPAGAAQAVPTPLLPADREPFSSRACRLPQRRDRVPSGAGAWGHARLGLDRRWYNWPARTGGSILIVLKPPRPKGAGVPVAHPTLPHSPDGRGALVEDRQDF
jgi:Family of unknown function (DUF6262)